MIKIDPDLKPSSLNSKLNVFWELSAQKMDAINREFHTPKGSPVVTQQGKYTTRGWTEWTQGFQFGSGILHFDATGDKTFLETARKKTVDLMAPHLTHTGVHDHGFNNVSTYGNLLRLMVEQKIPANEWEKNFYQVALKVSGAIQATRWTVIPTGGFIHSFNGPHSLFVDTIRSVRALILSHSLGHVLQTEGDLKINLLERALQHLKATAKFSIYYGEGRDIYDVPGRTAHESIFNEKDGNYRCPGSQQGYSPFTTWTRGLAWAMCGFAEELEWLDSVAEGALENFGEKKDLEAILLRAAKATCDFYITSSPSDGIPYWDTGAPNLLRMGDYLNNPADPWNEYEPVDSSAAAIASQGLLRLGKYLQGKDDRGSEKYWQAGLTVIKTLLDKPYLNFDPAHQGLILHSVYHRPNGWDHIPQGSKIPNGESSMWGDYHAREVCLYLQRINLKESYYTFFNAVK